MSLWTTVCCFVAIVHLFSQSLSIFRREGQLLNVTFNISNARCSPSKIVVILLDCVCCARLIRTRITVYPVSFHLLLPEFDTPEPRLINWCLKYQGVKRPNSQGVSCLPRFVCEMAFLTLCLTPERWMGLR